MFFSIKALAALEHFDVPALAHGVNLEGSAATLMTAAVVYRRQVGRDLAAGFHYYAAQASGLGEKFLATVAGVFEAIDR